MRLNASPARTRTTPRLRRAFATIACGALAVGASACESTEQESARLGHEGKHLLASQSALRLGGTNPYVHVSNVTVLSASGRTAVAVRLIAAGSHPQLDVPVLLDVLGAGGKPLYSNATGGLEASLQRMGLLRPGRGAWWVDDQVLTTQSATAAHVRVGRGTDHPSGPLPAISASVGRTTEQAGLDVLNGSLVNHSGGTVKKVPVFAVATRAGRVTAAGRALVPELSGDSTAPVPFQIFLVGNPAGANIQLTVAPTVA
jgi:hypothetical protein